MRLGLLGLSACAAQGYDVFVPAPLDDYSWSGPGLDRVGAAACSVQSDATVFASTSHVLLENRLDETLEVVLISEECAAEPLAGAPPQETIDLALEGGDVIQLLRADDTIHSTWRVTEAGLAGGNTQLVIR